MAHHGDSQSSSDNRDITVENLSTPPLKITPAPLLNRFLAGAVDSLIVSSSWLVLMGVERALPSHGSWMAWTSVTLTSVGSLVIIVFVYYFLLEGLFAATIGKRLLKLRVVMRDGDLCSFGASFGRNLVRFLDWLPLLYIVGAIAIFASESRERVGDKLAGTVVTRAPEKDINPPPAPFLFH